MQCNPKILAATNGRQLGAMIRCAYNIERDACPRYTGHPSVTSDGFIMCDFVGRDGDGHWGAFVGAHSDYIRNVHGVADHCKLTARQRASFLAVMNRWCRCQ